MSEFRPLAPVSTGQFSRWGTAPEPARPAPSNDPEAQRAAAWADGYAAGVAAAQEDAMIRSAQDDAARAVLADALVRFRPLPPEAVAARMARGLFDMVHAIVATCPVTTDELVMRCTALLAGIERDEGTPSLVLHPDDAALIAQCDSEIPLTTDATLARGSLRVTLTGGDRIDGRAERLAQLADIMDVAP